MKLEFNLNSFNLDGKLILSPSSNKIELMDGGVLWEEWIKNDSEVVSYRTIFKDEKDKANLYLIVTFKSPVNDNSLLSSWYLSPEKVMNGEQRKPEGKVTKALRKWFFDKAKIDLPISGDWGHIDAVYDHWNAVGVIACNYRSAFKDESNWKKYRKRNKF
ncbi:hypothetical protein [Erwinia psidii]|uniref:Uncharacterized protein n=1 Tax=Erwinia psidii TaxID=69224 RepID=A0A3N6UTZ7_9GAMM|nr:hypothetical protein [Erwinia psidii]MCX8963443.1 hypothetical protein [Erwinia psidii]RQM36315.1 hypothetical protein EB241_21200 [Erwinia psidii]